MSTVTLSRHPLAAPVERSLLWLIGVVIARRLRRRMRIRSDRALLRSMPDYLLADIGIARSDIAALRSSAGAQRVEAHPAAAFNL